MFSLKPLGGIAFAWAAALRLAVYALACLLFTPAVLTLTLIYDCTIMHGPCFTASLFAIFWVKPVIYALFVLSMIGIVAGRARHAGLPLWLAAGVLLLLIADLHYGVTLGFASGRNIALVGFWGGEPRFFLTAVAAIGSMCVLRPAEAAPSPWATRLGNLYWYAIACIAVLLVAAVWGALEAARQYPPIGEALDIVPVWRGLGRVLGTISFLGPLLLLPIAVREWRAAGGPGEGTVWHRAVVAAVVVICVAAARSCIGAVLMWMAPFATVAWTSALSIPLNALSLAALLAALALPALIAKMLLAAPAAELTKVLRRN